MNLEWNELIVYKGKRCLMKLDKWKKFMGKGMWLRMKKSLEDFFKVR